MMAIASKKVGPVCPECDSRDLTSRQESITIDVAKPPTGKETKIPVTLFYWTCKKCGHDFTSPCA
jgi:hypothetical protein